jgi:hypothetical protein
MAEILKFIRHLCTPPHQCRQMPCHLCGAMVCQAVWDTQWASCDDCWAKHLEATGQVPVSNHG